MTLSVVVFSARDFYSSKTPSSTLCRSRRSARVRRLPHSHPKKVLAESHTEMGPPSTVRSPHSSQISTTLSLDSPVEPSTRVPPVSVVPAVLNFAHPRGPINVNLPGLDASSGSAETPIKLKFRFILSPGRQSPVRRLSRSFLRRYEGLGRGY